MSDTTLGSTVERSLPQERSALDWFLTLGIVLVALIASLLGAGSLVVTGMGTDTISELVVLYSPLSGAGWAVKIGLSLVVLVLLVALAVLVVRYAERIPERLAVGLCVGATAVVGVAWVLLNRTQVNLFADAQQLVVFAQQVSQGDMQLFSPHTEVFADKLLGDLYLSNYPYQSGIFLFFVGVARLVGPSHLVRALQLINVLAAAATVWLAYRCAAEIYPQRKDVRLLAVLLAASCLPSVLFVVFPYGNALGFALALAAVAVVLHAMNRAGRRARLGWLALAGTVMLLALVIKPTFTIIAGGLVLMCAVWGLRRRWVLEVAASVVAFGLAVVLSGIVPVHAVEDLLGYSLPANPPKTAWIAMGLRDDGILGPEAPGWWSPSAINSQAEHDGKLAAQESDARASIVRSLAGFAHDPAYAARFFAKKLATEWLDPSFQSLYIASIGQRDTGALFEPRQRGTLHGTLVSAAAFFMDGFQSFVFVGAALGGIAVLRRRHEGYRAIEFVLPCLFFLGFGVYVLWEAKGMYTLPFFMLLLPLAARGWAAVGERILERIYGSGDIAR